MKDTLALPAAPRGGVREWVVGGFVAEAPIWLPCAILTFIAASVLMTGWPAGLVPNLSYPYHYSGDALSSAWVVQNLIEGHWTFHTDRSGYPFGSDLLDYPMSDWGSFAILRILGWLTGSYWATMNLYFLLGFPTAFLASYIVLRAMRVSVALAAAGSLLFTLLPYHFQRLPHLFLTWYFVVPIFFLFAWRLYTIASRRIASVLTVRTAFAHCCSTHPSASFGIYYAVFGAIVLLFGGLGGWLRSRSLPAIAATVAAVSVTVIGASLNVAPNLIHVAERGPNPEVAHRELAESEIYGLKMVQMLLPRADHRMAALGDVTRRYDSTAPLINENATATLGAIGATGLLLLGAVVCIARGRARGRRTADIPGADRPRHHRDRDRRWPLSGIRNVDISPDPRMEPSEHLRRLCRNCCRDDRAGMVASEIRPGQMARTFVGDHGIVRRGCRRPGSDRTRMRSLQSSNPGSVRARPYFRRCHRSQPPTGCGDIPTAVHAISGSAAAQSFVELRPCNRGHQFKAVALELREA